MKLLTASQMRSLEQGTFNDLGLPSHSIMENAGRVAALFLLEYFSEQLKKGVVVVAGGGNNGGDGFVVARTLHNLGFSTSVISLNDTQSLTPDSMINAKAYEKSGGQIVVIKESDFSFVDSMIADEGVVVDAIFGTGFKGSARGLAKEIISKLNELSEVKRNSVLAIDISSGVESDTGKISGEAIKADATIAFQYPKIGNVIFPGANYSGDLFVADVGIFDVNQELDETIPSLLTPSFVTSLLRENIRGEQDSHKGKKGHLLVVGGSVGHYGAPKMSGQAGLTAGAGLVTLALPKNVCEEVSVGLFEIMATPLLDDGSGNFGSAIANRDVEEILENKQGVVVGPGMGLAEGSVELLQKILEIAVRHKTPLVLDADALTIIANKEFPTELFTNKMIMTPHPGEMARLAGCSNDEVQSNRLGMAKKIANKYDCWVVLKGARTVIAGPTKEIYVNPAATDILATAGSGDVLSGIIGGLLARGALTRDAAIAGTFIHGSIGESLGHELRGGVGVTATDLIPLIPQVCSSLLASSEPPITIINKIL